MKKIWRSISWIGMQESLYAYEKKRLIIFNRINFVALLVALARLAYMFFLSPVDFSTEVFIINALPIAITFAMTFAIFQYWYIAATFISFIFFPPLLAMIAITSDQKGMNIFLVLYLMVSFLYLHRTRNILLAYTYIGAWYLLTFIPGVTIISPELLPNRPDVGLTMIDLICGLTMIFTTLYNTKHEVWDYQQSLKKQKDLLLEKNFEINKQQETLAVQAYQMELKNVELTELNNVKNKLFSLIAHDIRVPIYGLRNLVQQAEKKRMSVEEFQDLVPHIVSDLDKTVELMDNLLIWSRSQINNSVTNPQTLDLYKLTQETFSLLERNATNKKIKLENKVVHPSFAYGDKDMIQTVLRNLVNNAIKFTNPGGYVAVRTEPSYRFINVIVEDNGQGISAERQPDIFNHNYYTSPGTSQEMGSGLGLVICKELVEKNKGEIFFESTAGQGTSFTFSLPYNNTVVV
jgi:two-component system, sensor histidine kinase and response regulator